MCDLIGLARSVMRVLGPRAAGYDLLRAAEEVGEDLAAAVERCDVDGLLGLLGPYEAALWPAEMAALRHLMGLSLQGLADRLGVDARRVREWERGAWPIPAGVADEVWQMARAYAVEADRIAAQGGAAIDRHGPDRDQQLTAAGWALASGMIDGGDLRITWSL